MLTPKTVRFIRHGRSTDNGGPIFQRYDAPLNDEGWRQAEAAATRFARLPFEALISSPQMRAVQTAHAVAAASLRTVELSSLFIERFKPTSLNGKPKDDPVASDVAKRWKESLVTPGMPQVEDGETYESITDRAGQALDHLAERPESSLVVVSHGHFIKTMMARVLLGDALTGEALRGVYRTFSMQNTGITTFDLRDVRGEGLGWRISGVNDHNHLQDMR